MDEKGSPLHVLSDAAQNEESSAQLPAKRAAREGRQCPLPMSCLDCNTCMRQVCMCQTASGQDICVTKVYCFWLESA